MPDWITDRSSVLNSEGEKAPFAPDRFAGTLVRRDIRPDLAIRAADSVGGLLAGAETNTVTTDALRAASSIILENPMQPNLAAIRRVLLAPEALLGSVQRDSLPLIDFYRNVATAARADVLAYPRFALLGTAEQLMGGEAIFRQDLIKVASASDDLFEVNAGVVNSSRRLTRIAPFEIVPATGNYGSLAKARARCADVHELFNAGASPGKGLVTRTFILSTAPDIGALSAGRVTYIPMWIGFAAGASECALVMLNATSAQTQFAMVFAANATVLANSMLLTASFGGFVEGVIKVLEIVLMGMACVAVGGGGLASSPTVVGPLAAACLLILLLCGMVKKLIDLLTELFGETEAERLRRLLERLTTVIKKANELNDKLNRGEITKDDAVTQLDGLLDEANKIVDEAKDVAQGESALGPVFEALSKVAEAVAHAAH